MRRLLVFLPACLLVSALLTAQTPPKAAYPVQFFPVRIEGQELRMAYRDVKPTAAPNGNHESNYCAAGEGC